MTGMTCWIGIDHGDRRMGIATGSTETGVASPVGVLRIGDMSKEEVFARIYRYVDEYDADGVVVGWPLNMDGTEGARGRETRKFADSLSERLGVEVRLWDERLSSYSADEKLSGEMSRKKRRNRHDAVAASIFLEEFLASLG